MRTTTAPVPTDLQTQEQVAARLTVSPYTVRDWRRDGKGPAWIKMGGSVRYRTSDVEAWLDSQRRVPTSA